MSVYLNECNLVSHECVNFINVDGLFSPSPRTSRRDGTIHMLFSLTLKVSAVLLSPAAASVGVGAGEQCEIY